MMQETARLLRAYPAISSYEVRLLAKLLPELSILESGLLTADDMLAAKLAQFRAERGHLIKAPMWCGWAVVTALTIMFGVAMLTIIGN